MVDWKAAFSGKTVDEIANQLSQLPEERQQALQQALQLQGNILIAQPQPPQSWRLVILNNKSIGKHITVSICPLAFILNRIHDNALKFIEENLISR